MTCRDQIFKPKPLISILWIAKFQVPFPNIARRVGLGFAYQQLTRDQARFRHPLPNGMS